VTVETISSKVVPGSSGAGPAAHQVPDSISIASSFHDILVFARSRKVTDIHISANNALVFRQCGKLVPQGEERFDEAGVWRLIESFTTPAQQEELKSRGDLEFVYVIEGYGRFRLTLMKKRDSWDVSVRLIAQVLPAFEDTGMPESCRKLTHWAQGLVLVTGPLGCGKTTTMSVLAELINRSEKLHIITIENPIEVVFTPASCQISQREVLSHTLSQENALRAALREDPDVIIVSELRDFSAIQLAVTAAETGHLVLGTMNTKDVTQTILRLINSFPPEERSIMQNMISESLRGVICQQMIPTSDGKGVVPAYEVLIGTHAVSNIIRKGAFEHLTTALATGDALGMMTMDTSLMRLFKKGLISWDEAYGRSVNKREFESVKPDASGSGGRVAHAES
jgi:twitching motility protein PilT